MKLCLVFLLLAHFTSTIWADDTYTVTVKKVQEKKARGWSLSDWMLTKKKIALMDQWLAFNTSANNFEFFLSGGAQKYKWKHESKVNGQKQYGTSTQRMDWAQAGAYLRIFGVEGSWEQTNEAYHARNGHLALRIFGTAAQGTNLTLHYGLRYRKGSEGLYENLYYGGSSTIYLLPFLGVNGLFHYYRPDQSSQATTLTGQWLEYGTFIDLSFIRPQITYFQEKTKWQKTTGASEETRQGVRMSATLYF